MTFMIFLLEFSGNKLQPEIKLLSYQQRLGRTVNQPKLIFQNYWIGRKQGLFLADFQARPSPLTTYPSLTSSSGDESHHP